MNGSLARALRSARSEAELRQREVAVRAEIDQPMVSLYERGRREPTWPTFVRLLSACGAAADVRVVALPTDPSSLSIAQLSNHLANQGTDAQRRRLVLDFVGRYADADPARRTALLLTRPAALDDPQWEALLGALAEHLAFHDAVDPPMWCTEPRRFLDHPWFWVDLPSVRRRALTGAPTAFRRRNVWVDRSDLQRI
ncbi:MAG: helix-turn-helix domain-containing protein [Sporichthyaceae bacterium]